MLKHLAQVLIAVTNGRPSSLLWELLQDL